MTRNSRFIPRLILIAAIGALPATTAAYAGSDVNRLNAEAAARHAATMPAKPLPVPQLTIKRTAPPPPPVNRVSAKPHPGGTRDFYCKTGSSEFPACDLAFETKCENAGGNLSGVQGWGGKTCVEPTG